MPLPATVVMMCGLRVDPADAVVVHVGDVDVAGLGSIATSLGMLRCALVAGPPSPTFCASPGVPSPATV